MVDSRRILLSLSALCVISLSFLVIVTSEPDVQNSSSSPLLNYILTSDLADGEHEVRMRFGDIVVKETSVAKSAEKRGKTSVKLLLRQMVSGPDFLQMVFQVKKSRKPHRKDKLVECEVINDWEAGDEFRSQFQKELNKFNLGLTVPGYGKKGNATSSGEEGSEYRIEHVGSNATNLEQRLDEFQNGTLRVLRNDEVVGDLQRSFDIILHQRLCRRLHRKEEQQRAIVKSGTTTEENETDKPLTNTGFIFNWEFGRVPGTMWCGVGNAADKFSSLGAHVGADRCCRAHDGCPYQIPGFTSKYGLFNYRVHTTVSHCACDERDGTESHVRSRRQVLDAFLFPGTRWCGRGSSSKNLADLGGFTGADMCCRNHDLSCPYFIEGLTEKYEFFNWRPYTVLHCACDLRFRSCLKMTNTGAANFVGKVFFNVVQTKCFVLKPERTCAKTSWWGKCLKYEYKKQAYLRDPVPY